MLTYHSWISWHLNHGSHMTINCKQYHVRFNIKSFSRRTRFARSRKFRILARKIEFGVFRLFRIRKKYFREKTGFWWISIFFPHIIRKKFGIVRIDLGKKFGIVRIKVGNYHPYLENIVRFGDYSELARRKFPH
jgi:ribosomal protein L16/L10AE